jgi:copper resistance protein D
VPETTTHRPENGDSAVTGADVRAAPGWRQAGWVGLAIGSASAAAVLAGGLAATALPVLLGATVTRAAGDFAAVACVGLALVATLLPLGHARPPRELPDVLRGVDRATVAVAGLWLVLVLLGVGFRAAEAYGRPMGELGATELRTFALSLAAGRGLLLTAGCAIAVLVCAALRTRDPDRVPQRVVLVAALLGALTPAVTGHAGTSADHELAVVTVALHVAAAALWVGGLGALLVVAGPRPRLLDAVLPRFSTLAGGCLAAVVVTGVLNAVLRVSSLTALVTTGYGWLVLAKSVGVVALAGLGYLARRRLAARRLPVLRWAGIEVALMAVTLGVAAALTQTA